MGALKLVILLINRKDGNIHVPSSLSDPSASRLSGSQVTISSTGACLHMQ